MKDKLYTTLFRKDISIDAEHKPVLPIITTMSYAQLSMRRGIPKDTWKEKEVQKGWYFFKLQAADTIVPCHWCHCCQNLETPTVGKGYVCAHYKFVFSNEVNHLLILFSRKQLHRSHQMFFSHLPLLLQICHISIHRECRF